MTVTQGRRRPLVHTTRAALVVALAVALTGCIKMDMDLNVDGDTVSGEMTVGASREILSMTGTSEDQARQNVEDEARAGVPEEATVEPWEDDEFIGQRIVFDAVSLDEFNSVGIADSDLKIDYDAEAGTYEVSGSFDLTGGAIGAGEVPLEFLESAPLDIAISITFPGDVTEHNGELDGTTVTWVPALGETNEIRAVATSSESSGLPMWLLIALGVLAAVIVVALVLLVTRSSRRRDESAAADVVASDAAGPDGDTMHSYE